METTKKLIIGEEVRIQKFDINTKQRVVYTATLLEMGGNVGAVVSVDGSEKWIMQSNIIND